MRQQLTFELETLLAARHATLISLLYVSFPRFPHLVDGGVVKRRLAHRAEFGAISAPVGTHRDTVSRRRSVDWLLLIKSDVYMKLPPTFPTHTAVSEFPPLPPITVLPALATESPPHRASSCSKSPRFRPGILRSPDSRHLTCSRTSSARSASFPRFPPDSRGERSETPS